MKSNIANNKTENRQERLSILGILHLFLEYCDYETLLADASPANPAEQLFVSLNEEDTPEEEQILMHIIEAGEIINRLNPETGFPAMLQLYVSIAGQLAPDAELLELYALLIELNNLLPLGYFSYNLETGVFFKHAFVINPSEYKMEALNTIDLVRSFIVKLQPPVNAFVTGRISLEQCSGLLKNIFV